MAQVRSLVEAWYAQRQEQDPTADFHMEKAALYKALEHFRALDMEGLLLRIQGQPVAMTLGSFLTEQTFDVQFDCQRNVLFLAAHCHSLSRAERH